MGEYFWSEAGPMHRNKWTRFWRAVWLFLRLVFRDWYGRIWPNTAWEIASGIWNDCPCYGCKRERKVK